MAYRERTSGPVWQFKKKMHCTSYFSNHFSWATNCQQTKRPADFQTSSILSTWPEFFNCLAMNHWVFMSSRTIQLTSPSIHPRRSVSLSFGGNHWRYQAHAALLVFLETILNSLELISGVLWLSSLVKCAPLRFSYDSWFLKRSLLSIFITLFLSKLFQENMEAQKVSKPKRNHSNPSLKIDGTR